MISISFVVVSTIGMTLNTMPSIRVKHEGMDESVDNPRLALIEAVCISWFTIEYILRLAGNKMYHLSIANVCDYFRDIITNIIRFLYLKYISSYK